MRARTRGSRALIYLRLAFGTLLLLVLLKIVDFESLKSTLGSAKGHLIALGMVGILLNTLLMAYRWARILWIHNPDIPLAQVTGFYFIGSFLGNFLPTSFSSDFVKIYYVSRYNSDSTLAISSVVVDRIIGNCSLSVIAIISLLSLGPGGLAQIGSGVWYGTLAFLLLSIGVPVALLTSPLATLTMKVLRRLDGLRLVRRIQDAYEHVMAYRNQPRVLASVLGISFANQIVAILVFYVIALGFSAETAIAYFFLFVPLAWFLTMLPISIGGIGVLEASLVFLFSKVGMPLEISVSVALVLRGLTLLGTLPGWVIYAMEGVPSKGVSLKE